MLADRATLQSRPAEAQSFDGRARDPDRREEMALAASHHYVAAHVVAALAGNEGSYNIESHYDDHWSRTSGREGFLYSTGLTSGHLAILRLPGLGEPVARSLRKGRVRYRELREAPRALYMSKFGSIIKASRQPNPGSAVLRAGLSPDPPKNRAFRRPGPA